MRERTYRLRGTRAFDVFAHLLKPQIIRVNRLQLRRAAAVASSIMIMIGRDGLCGSEAFHRSHTCFDRFDRAIAWRCIGNKRIEQMSCGMSNIIDGAIERCLVFLGRSRETAQLADELKRRSANLVVRCRRTEVMKCFDGSAHVPPSVIVDPGSTISRCKRSLVR